MEWTMLYLFVALKVPIVAAVWLIWWAVRATDEPVDVPGDDGGLRPRRHPRRPLPRPPRRGPHGSGAPLPPPRVRPVRPVSARGRTLQR